MNGMLLNNFIETQKAHLDMDLEMKYIVIRIIILVLFFSYNISATSGYCERAGKHTHKNVMESIYEQNGITRITKSITYSHHNGPHDITLIEDEDSLKERITTIHDSIGNILFFKHYKWLDDMLVQTIDDSVVRNIFPGKTKCEFTIIEPSGDFIYFNLLDPKIKIDILIRNEDDFKDFLYGSYLFSTNTRLSRLDSIRLKQTPLDAIIYQWTNFCYFGKKETELIEHSSDSVSFNLTSENKYGSSYKYYAVFIIGIAVVCVVIIRKRRKRER